MHADIEDEIITMQQLNINVQLGKHFTSSAKKSANIREDNGEHVVDQRQASTNGVILCRSCNAYVLVGTAHFH